MRIPVLGMDPSLRNWGLASAQYDTDTGSLSDVHLHVIRPKEQTSKQVRKNSKDLEIAQLLAQGIRAPVQAARMIFVEVPVGSQSARAMASYGVCVGVLGAMQAQGYQFIEVTPTEVKLALTGNKQATKDEMIKSAMQRHPKAEFPMHNGKPAAIAEHVADALGAIYAGVQLPLSQQLLTLLKGTT